MTTAEPSSFKAPRQFARDLVLTRRFDAPLALVWAAWTEPERLRQWFFPEGCPITESSFELRPGGAYRCTFLGEDGTEHRLRGVFREIAPLERLVFTFGWADEDGVVELDTEVTTTFAARDGRTEVTVRQVGLETEAARTSHAQGWNEALDHLAAALERG